MTAYYNEIDGRAAAWLRELIKGGHIADGEVDERDIQDVTPADLRGFSQCHFFAGIGVWSYALRRAGWPDDRPVWTGSCPCQPFSSAGKGGGFDDERHVWPAWHWLIAQCRPATIFGEQVASKDAEPWLDLVQADLEGLEYAVGAEPYPSAGVGAPHIRDRLYWVADAVPAGRSERWPGAGRGPSAACGGAGGLADAAAARHAEARQHERGSPQLSPRPAEHGRMGGLVLSGTEDGAGAEGGYGARDLAAPAGPVNGLWRDADWLYCRDGIWRPVEPGTFPLAHGAPARVGRLRGYGNAINAAAAEAFIASYVEAVS